MTQHFADCTGYTDVGTALVQPRINIEHSVAVTWQTFGVHDLTMAICVITMLACFQLRNRLHRLLITAGTIRFILPEYVSYSGERAVLCEGNG